MAVAVIALPLLGVAEHVVGLGRLLEFQVRVRVADIAIGMILHGQLAVGALDLLVVRVARHAEDFVIVAFGAGHHDFASDSGRLSEKGTGLLHFASQLVIASGHPRVLSPFRTDPTREQDDKVPGVGCGTRPRHLVILSLSCSRCYWIAPCTLLPGSSSSILVTRTSVVSIRPAMLAAFCKAERVTLVGSTMPALNMSTYSPVFAL